MKKNNLYPTGTIAKFFLLIALFLLSSCSKSLDNKIAEQIKSKCSKFDDPYGCVIDLRDVTDFDWDNMYVFTGLTPIEDIYIAVGFTFKCKNVPDNYTRIIFVKRNKVVYQSQYYARSAKVQFRTYKKDETSFIHYSINSSKFYVLKKNKTLENEYFYDLYPVNGERDPRY